jgi:hypothetical protein
MPDLATSIRTLIDTEAPPISINEVVDRQPLAMRSLRTSRFGMVALGTAAAVVIAAVLVVTIGGTGKPDRTKHLTVLQSLPAGLFACMANPGVGQDGCPVSVPIAEQMLGISIPQPKTVPPGWVVIKQDVRQWPSNYSELRGVIPADFNQVWAPPGTNLSSASTPAFIQFNVQRAANYPPGGLAQFTAGLPQVTLPDGTIAYGTLSTTYSALNWISGGNVYRLRTGAPMSTQVVVSFIESLK